jgi:uncharacterized coiled-coil protein SlyX
MATGDRRQPKNHLPLIAVCISAFAFLLGPCMGAGVAVLGVYVSNQTKSVATDSALGTLSGEMKKVGEQLERLNEKMQKSEIGNGKVESDFANLTKRVDKNEGEIGRLDGRIAQQDKTIATIGGITATQVTRGERP